MRRPPIAVATPEAFLAECRDAVGDRGVLVDPDVVAGYVTDWTGRFTGWAPAVVRPRSVDEVAAVVASARAHGVALVPQGGNTGLVAGGIPRAGEVVVSLGRLTSLGPVDPLASQVTAGAGVTLAALSAHAAASGLRFGVDLGARDTATIGGMVATNAGGLHVIRHGAMRAQVVGVEAVLGTGDVVRRLGGLVKDNTGYDLAQLLCGSEGTLGIVTAARLRLVAAPAQLVTALVGVTDIEAAVALAAAVRREAAGIEAIELMTGPSLRLVAEHLQAAPPVAPDAGAYVLVEVGVDVGTDIADDGDLDGDGAPDPVPALAAVIGGQAGVLDAAVATERAERARLWHWREAHSEAGMRFGPVHKLDVTLPAGEIAGFCADVVARVASARPGARTLLFGHVGDGNVHVNVAGPPADDDEIDDVVLGLVVERGGSISAEHGIGTLKRTWLTRDRSPAEVAAMRAVKAALDPDGILNPGVLFTS